MTGNYTDRDGHERTDVPSFHAAARLSRRVERETDARGVDVTNNLAYLHGDDSAAPVKLEVVYGPSGPEPVAALLGEHAAVVECDTVETSLVVIAHVDADGDGDDGIDEAPDMATLAACIRDSTAAQGVDYYAVENAGYSIPEWADETERNRRTVRRNVERAGGET